LLLCCLIVCSTSSVQFGYNLGSLNFASNQTKSFIHASFFKFKELHEKSALFAINEAYLNGNASLLKDAKHTFESNQARYLECAIMFDYDCQQEILNMSKVKEKEIYQKYGFNMTVEEFLKNRTRELENKTKLLDHYRVLLNNGRLRVERATNYLYLLMGFLYLLGGVLGAYSTKLILTNICENSRKKCLLFHYVFSFLGSVLAMISYFTSSPLILILSRFSYGIQAGMSCVCVPIYLSEIAPKFIRGKIGTFHYLFFSIGLCLAQVLTIPKLICSSGELNVNLVHMLPIIPTTIGILTVLLVLSDTPHDFLIHKSDENAAKLGKSKRIINLRK
jgi:hypothetical protein